MRDSCKMIYAGLKITRKRITNRFTCRYVRIKIQKLILKSSIINICFLIDLGRIDLIWSVSLPTSVSRCL